MTNILTWNLETERALKNVNGIYIYGAGNWGSIVTKYCVHKNIQVKGIIVATTEGNIDSVYKIPVIAFSEELDKRSIIVVAVAKEGIKIAEQLEHLGYDSVYHIKSIPEGYSGYEYNSRLNPRWYEEENKLMYWGATKQVLDYDNPKSFNEKIQWIKLRGYTHKMTRLVDKYLVRQWIKEKIGEEYLVPLLGVWDDFDKIDFDRLPSEFILKCNHGSQYNYIVKDKSTINRIEMKRIFTKWLNENYAFKSFEMQYRDVIPQIISEDIIYQNSGGGLVDYKFHCFDGRVEFIQIIDDRDIEKHTAFQALYDCNGKSLTWCFDDYPCIAKERNTYILNEMKQLAEALSSEFNYVRVDFYYTTEGIKFGEMTFTPGNGMYEYKELYSRKIDLYLGSKINLYSKVE